MDKNRKELIDRFQKWLDTKPRKQIIASQCATIAEEYHKEQLKLYGVGKRFLTITEALGYLNRSGHTFKERIMLSDETIITIANEIFENQQLS